MTEFTFVELFAGIGGVSYGFEANGGKCVLAAEYDPVSEGKRQFAQEAYKLLHPGVRVEGDVFKLDEKEVPDHDVLSFTTPCQSFSVAGKRLGFEDIRGTLVFEALRIAKHKRPKILFMENVKGLVNHDKGKTLDVILHAMNEIGYTIDFNVLNSKYFGVPQNRERVFIIGVRDDLISAQPWGEERLIGSTMLPKRYRALTEQGIKSFNFDWPAQTSVDKRLRDVLEADVDENYYLAEDKTAKLVAKLVAKESDEVRATALQNSNMQGRRIKGNDEPSFTVSSSDRHGVCLGGLPIREATTRGYAIAREGDAVNIAFPSSDTRRGRVGEQMANTLEASGCNQGVVEEVRAVIKPDRTSKYQNGRRFKEGGEESFNCAAINQHGVALGKYPQYRIRKLTPRECMRLQGFPEWATDTLYDSGFSDSRIYKFAGNAVTTTVIKSLGEKILNLLSNTNNTRQ